VITFVTIPKPFAGHIGVIQRNAISSWLRVANDVQVLLLADEAGTAEVAAELGVDHQPAIARNEHGTPLLDAAWEAAERDARHALLCYVNADVMLPRSLAYAATAVQARASRFLVIGECWNARVPTPLDLDDLDWPALLHGARKRGADAIDYFLFPRGLYSDVPPFAVGRTVWDNWLVWRARAIGSVVVDATWTVRPIHQDHSYGHVGGIALARTGPEALENRRLLGDGRSRLYSRFDATHRLTPRGLVPNPVAVAHLGETVRRAWAKVGYTTGLRRE
jgi:hypothetical protein